MLVNQRVCTQMPREKVGLRPWVAGGKPALWTRHGCCDPRPSCQEELPSVTHIPCLLQQHGQCPGQRQLRALPGWLCTR